MIALVGDADVCDIWLLGRQLMPAEAPCQALMDNTPHIERKERIDNLNFICMCLDKGGHYSLPNFTYDQLNKGVTCFSCQTFIADYNHDKIICQACGYKETVTSAVLRNVEEFNILFPDKKITTNIIHEWCKIIPSKKTIRRILSSNFELIGHGKYSYYVIAKNNSFRT